MQTGKIIIPAIVGTSAMTLFSYLVSESKSENFREPVVLAHLIKRLPNSFSKDKAQIAGWSAHYATGLLFVIFYNEIWKRKKQGFTFPFEGWLNLNKFFGHLILAHVMFGIFSALAYKFKLAYKKS